MLAESTVATKSMGPSMLSTPPPLMYRIATKSRRMEMNAFALVKPAGGAVCRSYGTRTNFAAAHVLAYMVPPPLACDFFHVTSDPQSTQAGKPRWLTPTSNRILINTFDVLNL